MSRSVQDLARVWGVDVTVVLDGDELRGGRPRKRGDLKGAAVGIDFSGADAVRTNVQRAVDCGIPVVEGTTAWAHYFPDVEAIVLNGEGALLHAPNFSYGMNVLLHLVRQAADLFEGTEEFDPFVLERHHTGKADSPSGTALRLAEEILDRLTRKDLLQIGSGSGPIAPNQLSVGSLRAGSEPGRHLVGFDGPWEVVEIGHAARDRTAFAAGALRAAAWLEGKKGLFTMDDIMKDMLEEAARKRAAREPRHD